MYGPATDGGIETARPNSAVFSVKVSGVPRALISTEVPAGVTRSYVTEVHVVLAGAQSDFEGVTIDSERRTGNPELRAPVMSLYRCMDCCQPSRRERIVPPVYVIDAVTRRIVAPLAGVPRLFADLRKTTWHGWSFCRGPIPR